MSKRFVADDSQWDSPDWEDRIAAVYPKLLRFCLSKTHNRDESEDLVQATLTTAFQIRSKLVDISGFEAWIFSILRIEIRRWKRDVYALPVNLADLEQVLERSAGRDIEASPESYVLARNGLLEAFRSLSDPEKSAWLLRYRFGFTTPEVARHLHVSEDAAYKRCERANKVVREAIEGERAKGVLGDSSSQA